jgi:hypothetical protein
MCSSRAVERTRNAGQQTLPCGSSSRIGDGVPKCLLQDEFASANDLAAELLSYSTFLCLLRRAGGIDTSLRGMVERSYYLLWR